jgi:hypothetical protein
VRVCDAALLLTALPLAGLALAGCASAPGLPNLSGRQVCWTVGPGLEAMTIEGVLEIDGGAVGHLLLADGRIIEIGFAKYGLSAPNDGPGRVEASDGSVVAIEGERLLLFGGLTTDGRLFHACEIDARQPAPG